LAGIRVAGLQFQAVTIQNPIIVQCSIIMSFGQYKNIADVIQKYPLKIASQRFLPNREKELPELFLDNIDFSLEQKTAYDNETFLAENFIYPFLHFTWKHHRRLKVWSRRTLNYDEDLCGEPDYFVSYWPNDIIDRLVISPLLAVVEAKKQDFDQGWGQCLAEMIACQKINQDDRAIVYGIVSTGTIWEFGQLEKSCFTQEKVAYSLANPQLLAGILDHLFANCEAQAQNFAKKEVAPAESQ